jgi:hypothetical protein
MKISLTNHWNQYLNRFKEEDKDVYFEEEYVYLYQNEKERACCIIIEDEEKCMIFPFLRRTFEFRGKTYFDFETAYGYGGPIYNTNDIAFRCGAMQCLSDTLKQNSYVAGFVRFHPLLSNYAQFEEIGNVVLDRKTIAIDLSLCEDEIWMHEIHTKNRNIIKKGEKNGLKFVADYSFSHLNDFIRLYNLTMDKLSADTFYYFDDNYYRNLVNNIHNSFLGIVKYGDEIVSAAIFFYEGMYAHYHLSGSNKDYLNLMPNNFMLYKAALELKKRGALSFHLGGGTTSSPDDSLFCFKSRFSKSQYQFAIGKMILNDSVYNELCNEWEANNPEKQEHYKNFLLKYKY